MIKRCTTTIGLIAIWMAMVSIAPAIEVAPRISDREIIEGLSELKQGNRDLNDRMGDLNQSINKRIDDTNNRIDDLTQGVNKRFDDLNQSVNKRFDDTNKRIDDTNKRIDDLNQSVNKRFDDLTHSMNLRFSDMQQSINQRLDINDQRFMAIEQRFDGLQNLIVALFGSVMALIIMLIGYMIWDRKTAQQPMKARMTALETQMNQKLDPNDTDHSNLARILAVQRIMAQDDPKLAETMRGQALL